MFAIQVRSASSSPWSSLRALERMFCPNLDSADTSVISVAADAETMAVDRRARVNFILGILCDKKSVKSEWKVDQRKILGELVGLIRLRDVLLNDCEFR